MSWDKPCADFAPVLHPEATCICNNSNTLRPCPRHAPDRSFRMKTPIKCACIVCNKDLTAQPATTRALGHETRTLRAPARARVTYQIQGGAAKKVKRLFVEFYLCEAHGHPADAWGALAVLLQERVKQAEQESA